MAEREQGNIRNEVNSATTGLNMDQTLNQIEKGKLTYALNAAVENFDNSSVNYQNESANEFCVSFPEGFVLIGKHYIQEKNKHIFFLTNPLTRDCHIGYMDNNDCVYRILINDPCLGWDVRFPIHKIVHKITNCTTEIYWPDNIARRYLDLENIPYKKTVDSPLCDPVFTNELDCNQLKVQPNFNIPELKVVDAITGGNNTAGTVQFAAQYADAQGNPYTSYYSITNPTPIADNTVTTPNFNYNVGKSIVVNVSNLDDTGQFQYFNLAVIKTVNDISSVELIGTYYIDSITKDITYSGQNVTQIRLTIADIFEKFPYYDLAKDVTAVQDVLVWDQLTTIDRINFQKIANQIKLYWETYKIPATENYSNELNATNLRSYLRDEVYAFEFVPLFRNGKQGDSFHIPGRMLSEYDLSFPDVPESNPDFIGEPSYINGADNLGYSPYWKIYNTARVLGPSTNPNIGNATAHEYGEFAYWESQETYSCDENLWGELAGQPIRHHKFPDVLVSPIYESGDINYNSQGKFAPVMGDDAVFPIGLRIDPSAIQQLILSSPDLTLAQKEDIVGFKIVRGNRGTNKSIVAKGILRNIGAYEREEQMYYFPNYPYNQISEDPFLTKTNNAFAQITKTWLIICSESGEYEYGDPNTNKLRRREMVAGETYEICSTERPRWITGKAEIGPADYDVYEVCATGCRGFRVRYFDPFSDVNLEGTDRDQWVSAGFGGNFSECDFVRVSKGGTPDLSDCSNAGEIRICKCDSTSNLKPIVEDERGVISNPELSRRSTVNCGEENPLFPVTPSEDLRHRQIFNSPETSFGQPFLGNVLKLESTIFGGGKAHFVEVKNNAKYKLLSKEAQIDAIASSNNIGAITNPFNAGAMFAAYQAYLTIYINGITRRNYAYSFNSIADYNYFSHIPNDIGVKQRTLDLKRYLIPGVQSVGDEEAINNYNRESSVYLRTDLDKPAFAFPQDSPNMVGTNIVDYSKFTIGESDACSTPGREQDITVLSYYASLKNIFPGQWGQIYSYDTVDTGYQHIFGRQNNTVIFGGDTFISRFSFKTKLPFFTDNRVGAPDDSDIFYDEIGNIAYPKYWHSARSILEDYTVVTNGSPVLKNFISYKAHNFDCPNDPSSIDTSNDPEFSSGRTFYDGYFYLFAYGQPNFYCESSYNLDLRQAFNNREGDFWPHVSTGIPDDWVQESFVSILNDNTYTYNVTFSKQNTENTFTHLPADWEEECYTDFQFRAIFSEQQAINSDVRVNSWLIYRPINQFDFPQIWGNLTSLDGIDNKQVLARFENKSLLYNALYTTQTNVTGQVYLGQGLFSGQTPPLDFAETDLGYVGSQNKMLLRLPIGQLTIDAKRGQIFLLSGGRASDITGFGSGVNRFMTDHLAFEILKYFPNVPTDNHFNGFGLHGVFDSKFERVLITKLDYIPLNNDIKYDETTDQFYIETFIGSFPVRTQVYITDPEFFCNKSWTMSFNLNTKSWISFHSYIPNWYIGDNNFFYSGLNSCCGGIEAEFGIMIGDDEAPIPTTTTTTSRLPLITTTTTTTAQADCELEGTFVILDCEFEITALRLSEPITTTTVCARPLLPSSVFVSGYQLAPDPSVDFSGSKDAACEALAFIGFRFPDLTFTSFTVSLASLSVGQVVYLDSSSSDCTLVPDGWYINDESLTLGLVIEVVDGVIVSLQDCSCPTTTTTTTQTPEVTDCCGILFDVGDQIYYVNPNGESGPLEFINYTSQMAIGMTYNKLWSMGAGLVEWDIVLSPFVALYLRTINLPVGFVNAAGITGKDNITLFAVDDTSPQTIVEINVFGANASITAIIATLPVDRIVTTNLLYSQGSKILAGTYDTVGGDYYISQFDIASNTLEYEINVGTIPLLTIFDCQCNLYVATSSSDTYLLNKETETLEEVTEFFVPLAYSAAQQSSCVNSNIAPTTTSTTTVAPTTTSTTTEEISTTTTTTTV